MMVGDDERGCGVELAKFEGSFIVETMVPRVGDVKLVPAAACGNEEYEPCVSMLYPNPCTAEELDENRLMLRPWFCAE
jgi:hypothetical protein